MTSYIKPVTRDGQTQYLLVIYHDPRGGRRKRERVHFATQAEAESVQESIRAQYDQRGVIWTHLSPREQAEVMLVMWEARELKITLRGLLEYYKTQNAVGIARIKTTVAEMVRATVAAKQAGRRRARYVSNLKSVLDKFAQGREGMLLSQVTPWMINDFLASQKGRRGKGLAEGSTLKGLLTRLRTMFAVATKGNAYLDATANPMLAVDAPYVDAKPPKIFTAEDAGKLLRACWETDKAFLPYLTLGLFAGIRPEELEKLRWSDIHLDDGEIVIDEGVSKTRARRVLEIEPILKEWLALCSEAGAEYIFEAELKGDRLGQSADVERRLSAIRQTIGRHRNKLCELTGVQWHQDILRKTCASWLMHKYENETKVAAMLGNSPKVLHDHYRGLLRRKDGEQFETLTPSVLIQQTQTEQTPTP